MGSSSRGAILVAAGDIDAQQYLETALVSQGFVVQLADRSDEICNTIKAINQVSLVVLDQAFAPEKHSAIVSEIRRIHTRLPIVLMTSGTFESPIERLNGYENILTLAKPVFYDDLVQAIAELLPTDSQTIEATSIVRPYFEFSSQSLNPRMRQISKLIDQAARCDVPVLVQGETGVGKEMLVREIHSRSRRASRPFVNINCAALPKELVESQLFGHERGAFTGAHRSQPGLFEVADGGTILLDEIGDMDIRLQAKLLQVLQDNEFHRLGGGGTVRVDVRVMAATHRDLNEAVANGLVRADLFYRLKVVSIVIPPVRERRDEIVALAEFFLKKHTPADSNPPEIDLSVKRQLLSYDWPGNVRELENMMRRYLVLRDVAVFQNMLPPVETSYAEASYAARAASGPAKEDGPLTQPAQGFSRIGAVVPNEYSSPQNREERSIFDSLDQTKRQAQVEALVAALNASQWNRKKAADLLRLDYKQLLYQMKKLQIEGANRRTRSRSGLKPLGKRSLKANGGTAISDPWLPVRQLS